MIEEDEDLQEDVVEEGGDDDMPQLQEIVAEVEHSSLEHMPELEKEGAVGVGYERRKKRVQFAKEVVEYIINRQLDELLLNRQKILIDRLQINVLELVPQIEFQEEMIL